MAHGHMNESPLYICTKGGKYIIRKEDGCLGEHYFSKNDVIGCDGQKYVSIPDFNAFRETGPPFARQPRAAVFPRPVFDPVLRAPYP